ncbi:hypothetical protein DAPPUDRAFT_244272 [Daphnia pulex]|uniref:Uncharacterized protein n=1 Tax=Daphnia pulex TaxID=6669 RepID=E9GKK9_DAPPU|nr:hypothetical protein DAPPUDRAFT_244272 [Daphnia pulex]|eukprot:EFX80045.1 hypothetical protein DAPPUDRAFT_244272 [Daphnia pulex]
MPRYGVRGYAAYKISKVQYRDRIEFCDTFRDSLPLLSRTLAAASKDNMAQCVDKQNMEWMHPSCATTAVLGKYYLNND